MNRFEGKVVIVTEPGPVSVPARRAVSCGMDLAAAGGVVQP